MAITLDAELTARANDLLRTEPRLLAGTPLVGRVAVLYRDPKPEPAEAAAPKADKMPPQRVDGSTPPTASEQSGEVTAAPPGPAPCPSPWHAVAVLAKADGLAKFPPDLFPVADEDTDSEEACEQFRMNGGPILAKITIDGTLWERLDGKGQTAALVTALRGLRHKMRASDDADLAVVEKPPIRCWPDTTGEAGELMTQLGPDGAQGAALLGSLADGDEVANLAEAIAKFRRRLDAGQDLYSLHGALDECGQEIMALLTELGEARSEAEVYVRDMDAVHPPTADGPHGDVDFYAVSGYGDGTPSHCEIGWGHSGRDQFGSDAEWSAFGWGLYEGGDLHDGHRTLREVMDDFGPHVFLSMDDFKRDRSVAIEQVIDAARAWASLPPLAETPKAEINGKIEEAA